jgi:NRAMP (natural resistance-associated macrophage protein)-like metal ion transporter
MEKKIVEKIVDAPAKVLERGVSEGQKAAIIVMNAPGQAYAMSKAGGQKIADNMPENAKKSYTKAKNYWYLLGPGLTTGASDDDPSGIATYSQTGAQYGFSLLWLAFFTMPLMAVVQEMCARIGLVTGRGLAGNIKRHFPKSILYTCTLLLFAANTFNIGADIGAMAQAVQLLLPKVGFTILVISFTTVILLLQVFTPYVRYAKYLKWLALVLFAYIISALLAKPDWPEVIKNSFIPHIQFNKAELLLICAILGTTISPYLFFWQTSQEIENEVADGQTSIKKRMGTDKEQVKRMRIDVWSGMILSNVVMFFIITACAGTLFAHGITNITTASQAAEALKPLAGNATYYLFALGIIGMGMLAIPVLAGSSSYAITESLGKQQGLNHKLSQAHTFYGVIIISMIVGLGMNFIGINPIKALIYSAVANGIVAPVILIAIMLLASDKKIMGEWKNKKSATIIGWGTTGIMVVAGLAAIYSIFPQ